MKSTTTELEKAKKTLEDLRAELPRYHGLLTDIQQREAELQKAFRAGTGKFSELTEAKNATMTARELLEQHQSEIASAQAEVNRLEAAVAQERAGKAREAAQQAFERAQAAWKDQALGFMAALEDQAHKLYRQEARVQAAWHALDEASKAVGADSPRPPEFYLLPTFKEINANVSHVGGGVTRLELQPGSRPYLRVTIAPLIPHPLYPRD